MAAKLTSTQGKALEVMRAAGGALDYHPELYGFAAEGAPRAERVVMGTAKALIAAGLVTATRTKSLRGEDVPDRIELVGETTSTANPLASDAQ